MRWIVLAALICARAEAAVIHVHAPASCSGTVVARTSTSEARQPVAEMVTVPDGARVRVEAEGCWSPEIEGADDLTVFRSATLHGRSDSLTSLTVRISGDGILATDDTCVVQGREWRCLVPATKIDVRLVSPDGAAQYLWDLQPDHFDLGELTWHRGASVVGWVRGQAKVHLTADGVPVATTATNARGFFQFTEVGPRTYGIEVIGADNSSAKRDGIAVVETSEYEVKPKLVLEPPPLVEIAIDPPTDAESRPWTVRLSRYEPNMTRFRAAAEGLVSPAGIWTRRGLRAGEYHVEVLSSAGSVFHREDVEIASGMAPIRLRIERISIRGRVTVATEPLPSNLEFHSGSARVSVETDENAVFHGDLPSEGKWDVTVSPRKAKVMLRHRMVDVHRAAGESITTVDIALRGGTIAGTVIDAETGRGVAANVFLMRDGGHVEGFGASDEDGSFEYPAIRPGRVDVSAESRDGDSGPVPADVVEGEKVTVRVPVHRSVKFELSLVMRDGSPVAGAIVSMVSPSFMEIREAVSGPLGQVSVDLPHTTSKVDMTIVSPGLPTRLLTMPIVNGRFPVNSLTVGETGGQLVVRLAKGWPFVSRDGSGFIGLTRLTSHARWREAMRPEGFTVWVEPGRYTMCPQAHPSPQCVEAVVTAGATVLADARRN